MTSHDGSCHDITPAIENVLGHQPADTATTAATLIQCAGRSLGRACFGMDTSPNACGGVASRERRTIPDAGQLSPMAVMSLLAGFVVRGDEQQTADGF